MLKYALNLDPQVADVSGLPQAGVAVNPADGNLYLTFVYRHRIDGGGLLYTVEVSEDLVTWNASGGAAELTGTPVPASDGITETVSVRIHPAIDPASNSRQFVRLRVAPF